MLNVHIKALIPVRVQGLLDNASCVCLLRVDSDDRKRVGQAEDLALRKTIGSNN